MEDDGWPHAGRLVTMEPAGVFKSPAFRTVYPTIVNPDLIKPSMRVALESTWNKGLFEERNIEVFFLNGGYVIDENLVFDDALQAVANVDDDYTAEEIAKAVDTIRQRTKSGRIPHLDGVGIVAKRRAANNYGHYLLYMVPLALLGKKLFGQMNPRYLIHQTTSPMHDVVLRSFRLLGINLDRVLMFNYGQPVHFEGVIFITGLAVHGSYLSPVAVQAVVDMAQHVPPSPHRKIFVRRIPGWRRGRLLRNEEEIARRLAGKGFEIVEPGAMSLEQQVSTFKGADHVVGSAGAGMSNIAFCQPGTNVTLLWPSGFPDTFFWFIAQHRKLNYIDVRGEPIPVDGLEPWLADFTIKEADIQLLEACAEVRHPLPQSADAVGGARILAHAHNVGDITGTLGDWIPGVGSSTWIEGISIALPVGWSSTDIEYQTKNETALASPWVSGETYCGTRGLSRPIVGVSVRLRGLLGALYDCYLSAAFTDGSKVERVPAERMCMAQTVAPLTSFRIIFERRIPIASGPASE